MPLDGKKSQIGQTAPGTKGLLCRGWAQSIFLKKAAYVSRLRAQSSIIGENTKLICGPLGLSVGYAATAAMPQPVRSN